MHNSNSNNMRGAFLALGLLGGYVAWRNRFAIQRQLEALGLRTPLLPGSLAETARSVASKVSGRMEHGATIAENFIKHQAG